MLNRMVATSVEFKSKLGTGGWVASMRYGESSVRSQPVLLIKPPIEAAAAADKPAVTTCGAADVGAGRTTGHHQNVLYRSVTVTLMPTR